MIVSQTSQTIFKSNTILNRCETGNILVIGSITPPASTLGSHVVPLWYKSRVPTGISSRTPADFDRGALMVPVRDDKTRGTRPGPGTVTDKGPIREAVGAQEI